MLNYNSSSLASTFDCPDRYYLLPPCRPPGSRHVVDDRFNRRVDRVVADPTALSRHWRQTESTMLTFAVTYTTFALVADTFLQLVPHDRQIWYSLYDLGYWCVVVRLPSHMVSG